MGLNHPDNAIDAEQQFVDAVKQHHGAKGKPQQQFPQIRLTQHSVKGS